MAGALLENSETLSLEQLKRIEGVCTAFEAVWKAGGPPPRVEDYLGDWEDPERTVLLRELRALDDYYRQPSPLPPGYRFLGVLGRGGMGVVYLARQQTPDRVVALKVIRPDLLAGLPCERRQDLLRRFREEAEVMARLEHPNVVTVYEVGEFEGRPFYSMRYVRGPSLADVLAREGPLPPERAAACLEPVARAVSRAHAHGVLHRDLKPHNILVDDDGRPYVADFGLAKWREAAPEGGRPGELLGTLPYMSPEQSRDAGSVTRASDVYGLGATLYALLTGRPPLRGETLARTLEMVRVQEPVPPRRLRPGIDRELEAICLKCLEKDPGRRYESADALAAALGRYLEALRGSGRASEFTRIARGILVNGAVFFAAHLAVFLLLWLRGPEPLVWLALFGPYAPLFAIFRSNRPDRQLPPSPAERQLASIWLGHLLASAAVFLACRWPAGPDYVPAILRAYPGIAALAGLAHFSMGGTYWRGHYAFGLAWMVLAALMPLAPAWSPLETAALSGASNFLTGLHLLGRRPGLEEDFR